MVRFSGCRWEWARSGGSGPAANRSCWKTPPATGSGSSTNAGFRKRGLSAFAGHPLEFRGEILGVLAVFSRERLGPLDFGWLRAFADQAAIAIANARAFEEIERLRRQLESENSYLREEVDEAHAFGEIIGRSPALGKLLEQIELVAPTKASVLILGESGTGKELVARAIHQRSGRSARPLVKVNCAAVPRELFESEFFGHVKGSFTGAVKDRIGRFQLADGGTLFLDEVGEIPLDLQGKLLRVLQEGQIERVGDDETRQVDVRVIAATNRDLEADVAAGRFRQDLYFRLSVFPIEVVPLRERTEDIPLLGPAFFRAAVRADESPGESNLPPRSLDQLRALCVAGQRPRAAKCHRTRGDQLARRTSRASTICLLPHSPVGARRSTRSQRRDSGRA